MTPLPSEPHRRSESSPMRTCVGCRQRCPQGDLLRIVCVDGRVLPDPKRGHPGRGAYLHLNPDCWHQAVRRRAFGRALRVAGPLDFTGLAEVILDS